MSNKTKFTEVVDQYADATVLKGKDQIIAKLKAELHYLRQIIAALPGNVYWKDSNGVYQGCNENAAEMLKLKAPENIIGKQIHDVVNKCDADKVVEIDSKVMQNNSAIMIEEIATINDNESTYLSQKIPLHDEEGNVIGLLGISFDITERKKLEQQLLIAKNNYEEKANILNIYYKNILANLPENFYWVDRDGRVLGCNDNQAKLFGLSSASELIGKTINDIAEMLGWDCTIAETVRENDIKVMTTRLPIKAEEIAILDGQQKTFISFKNPLLNDNNEVIGIFGVTVDITERKQMEQALLEAKQAAETANQIKSEFLMNISHDIRTPFSGILGFTNILQAKETDPEKKQILGYIAKSSEELLNLVNEILDASNLNNERLTVNQLEFNLNELINNITNLMLNEISRKGLELKTIYAANIPQWLIGDRTKLHRILLNLLGNAIKFTQKGYVALIIDLIEQKDDSVMLSFSVEDSGIGIPETKYDTIFERFSRLTSSYDGVYSGAGLGLYIVKQLVEHLNGKIAVKSKLNHGSTFTVNLPFKLPDSQDASVANSNTDVQNSSILSSTQQPQKRILLVEDNLMAQKVAQMILEEQYHFIVDIANTGQQAIALAKQHHYQLILMDIGLPDENGFLVTQKIRALGGYNSKVLIVGLTAHVNINEIKKAATFSMDKLLPKPLSIEICNELFASD